MLPKFRLLTINGVKQFVMREPIDWIAVTFDLTIYAAIGGMAYCILWLLTHVGVK